MTVCDISVVIPTYQRTDDLLLAIEKIQQCEPQPSEIIVHIDFGDYVTRPSLQSVAEKYNIVIIQSDHRVGPGGGRNKAINIAKNDLVASFDDDSYPLDLDYFSRLKKLFEKFPDAAVIGATIFHQNETIAIDKAIVYREHSFVGCGCAYRRKIFLEMQGYVELPVAYGMEEVDLSLRLYDANWQVLISPWLRVYHNTALTHHTKPKITAASISNQILLMYLRYPITLWWIGIGQTLSRIIWLIKHQRFAGIVSGIVNIPSLIYQNKKYRSTVKAESLKSFLVLKRNPVLENFMGEKNGAIANEK